MAGLVQPWDRWDALWLRHIATSGYRPGREDAAFFPVYPLLEGGVGRILGGNYAVAGLAISTIALVLALFLLHRLVARDLDDRTARRAVTFIALAPMAFFLLAPYSEALFLCLSVAAFLCARQRRWALAGLCALLAAWTRPTGVLLMAPLLVEAGLDVRDRMRSGERPLRWGHLLVLAPAVGFLAWEAYVRNVLAVPDGVQGAARYWGQQVVLPWQAIADSVSVAWSQNGIEWLNVGAVVGLATALVFMWRRLPRSYTVYAAAMVVPMGFREAMTTPLQSDARYVVVVFPLFVLLAMAARRRWVHLVVLSAFVPLLGVLFVLFAGYGFIG
jgi:Gpi18-like mannosyltransferase